MIINFRDPVTQISDIKFIYDYVLYTVDHFQITHNATYSVNTI